MKNEILVVDDEAIVGRLIKRNLADDNLFVSTLPDGSKVLETILQKKPCLVVLDVRMPGKDGFEVLQEIKKELPDVPVAILTAYYDFVQANRAFKMGACAYLEKPIDWDHFRNVVYTNVVMNVSPI
jgi:DNA-binding NtrC family response regulator